MISGEEQEGKACVAPVETTHFETLYTYQELSVRNLWGLFPKFLTTSLLINGLDSASDCMYSTPSLSPASLKTEGKLILDISVFLLITSTNLVGAD